MATSAGRVGDRVLDHRLVGRRLGAVLRVGPQLPERHLRDVPLGLEDLALGLDELPCLAEARALDATGLPRLGAGLRAGGTRRGPGLLAVLALRPLGPRLERSGGALA